METQLITMTSKFRDCSIVILAKNHNPTILHPSFLTAQKIVPNEWILDEDPICTSPFSIVKYKNKVVFLADPSKLQISDNDFNSTQTNTPLPLLAQKYVETLPHVNYSAIGINFMYFMEMAGANDVVNKLFDTDFIKRLTIKPKSSGVRFVFPVSNAEFRLDIEPSVIIEQTKDEQSGLLIKGNYSTPGSPSLTTDEIRELTDMLPDRLSHFNNIINEIVNLDR